MASPVNPPIQTIFNGTISTNFNPDGLAGTPSAQFSNYNKGYSNTIVMLLKCGTVTGTTPTCQLQLYTSPDGVNWFFQSTLTTLNSTGQTARVVLLNVLEPFLSIGVNIGGTTPSFANVLITAVFPDFGNS